MSWEAEELADPAGEPEEATEPAVEQETEEAPEEPQEEEAAEPPAKRHKAAAVVKQQSARYALKVLCTDELTKCILGARGKRKDDMQAETGTRLTFSNKGDYFPDSHFRVLGLFADDPSSISSALEKILPKLVECGDQERSHPPPHGHGPDLVGKEPGEYIFRLALSKKTSSGLIGSGGQNIKQIRADAGIKLFIENETVFGHQMARIIGQPDAILKGLQMVNDFVHEDAGSEAYQQWMQLINFSEVTEEGAHYEQRWEAPADTYHSSRGPASHGGAEWEYPPSGGDPGVDMVVEAVHSMPPDPNNGGQSTASLSYMINFYLPDHRMHLVAGEQDEFFRFLFESMAAEVQVLDVVTDEGNGPLRQLSLTGPLMNIYAAHMQLIKKVADIEREEQEAQDNEAQQAHVQDLQAKMAELQSQLEQAMGPAGGSGKSKGAGEKSGKSKGKGKGKSKKGKT